MMAKSRQTVLSRQITTKEPLKGVLMSYTLTDLRIPLSYEVSLAPITSFATGNTVTRTIQYSEPYTYQRPSDYVCGFEDNRICGFTQDRSDIFDWTRQNHLTQNPKRSVNTGPDTDRSGTKEGYYMYIETSRPRQAGDRARLLSPLYNVTAARGPAGSTRTPYCISFYYHMNGKHIGSLNVLMRVKSIATVDSAVWSLSGHQGAEWRKADAEIYPSGPFQLVGSLGPSENHCTALSPQQNRCTKLRQSKRERERTHHSELVLLNNTAAVHDDGSLFEPFDNPCSGDFPGLISYLRVVFEGIRGNGFEGDIAIDDVSVTKGKCKLKDSVDKTAVLSGTHKRLQLLPVNIQLLGAICLIFLFR
ncbi:hypothetical protein DNTS_008636 [Danionella cerebrum]|uniref:MAM domain-containing protein n=1 Tax=Danionella cerebrum TaxID=2873325 RepID=A0A553P916_9TELE|nr:hypothetical protein DNTS_008636 [Danionella translucida]